MKIVRLDHLVLTVADIGATCRFYERVLGMKTATFGQGRTALHFGRAKINLHRTGKEFEPKALRPTPGSADLCFIAETPLARVIARVKACGVAIELGPVARTGAEGAMTSIYLRDPDQNLIEIANYRGGGRIPAALKKRRRGFARGTAAPAPRPRRSTA